MNSQILREEFSGKFANKVEYLELQKKIACLEVQLAIANDKIVRLQESEYNLETKLKNLEESIKLKNNNLLNDKSNQTHYVIDT